MANVQEAPPGAWQQLKTEAPALANQLLETVVKNLEAEAMYDRSACTGSFSSGAPCPAAGMCDRYRLGLASDSPRQVWSIFDADATGQRCDEFRESPPDREAQARAGAEDNPG
jgi:hypothetical protein